MFIVRKQLGAKIDEQSFGSETQAILVASTAWKTGYYNYISVYSIERNETVVEFKLGGDNAEG